MKNLVDVGGGLSVGEARERCKGSAAREVRKDVAESWKLAESPEGHSWHELRLRGYFVPNTTHALDLLKSVRMHYLEELNIISKG